MALARGTAGLGDRGTGRGFTLIEVIVALVIGSAVVLMVHQAFGAVLDLSARLDAEREAHGQRMHARDALELAFSDLEIGFPGTVGFDGQPDRVTFSAVFRGDTRPLPIAIESRSGWLILRRGGDSDSLVPASSVRLDYLLSYGAQSSWVENWHSPASTPLAVRIRLGRQDGSSDTLLFVVGPRG